MSVTHPAGFRAAGVAAGIKADAPDLAIVINDGPADDRCAAGIFTANRIQAAPVIWSKQTIGAGQVRAVVLNSGGANACTGPEGYADTVATAERAATALGLQTNEVVVCSTGLIGERLPMDKLLPGVDAAVAQLAGDGGPAAATAIMTTDTHPKTAQRDSETGYAIGGMAKGAGMLAPELATMLVVLTTDAVLTSEVADHCLRLACRQTFERLDSDGCMSTNDSVILLGSGASGHVPDLEDFCDQLTAVCADLAAQLLADAEGASHDIAIEVHGASNDRAALAVGRAVARSNLLKAAIFGNDPNWGRVLSALGTVPEAMAPFEADQVDVAINGVQVCRGGAAGEDRSGVQLAGERQVEITIDLHAGEASATVWTNDLTYDYVTENSAYSS